MKPPLRPRSAPARFRAGPGAAVPPLKTAWTVREKRALLRALRDQAALGLPEPQPWRMKEWLPRRSEAEIRLELTRLRGRAAREAVGAQRGAGLRDQQQHREQRPAPIQVWLQLAQTVSAPLEEAAAAAFSQALTVAGTEPLSLKGGALGVDYERLYGFLARGARGGDGPELQPAEAAVLLALLASLPPQLQALPHSSPLRCHLRGSFSSLSAPRSPPRPDSPPPKSPWRSMGLCPLNPFLVPLWLLRAPPPPSPLHPPAQ